MGLRDSNYRKLAERSAQQQAQLQIESAKAAQAAQNSMTVSNLIKGLIGAGIEGSDALNKQSEEDAKYIIEEAKYSNPDPVQALLGKKKEPKLAESRAGGEKNISDEQVAKVHSNSPVKLCLKE